MDDYSNNLLELDLVLVPGFEPGSTDRESVMMDQTTPHQRQGRRPGLGISTGGPYSTHHRFTFTGNRAASRFSHSLSVLLCAPSLHITPDDASGHERNLDDEERWD